MHYKSNYVYRITPYKGIATAAPTTKPPTISQPFLDVVFCSLGAGVGFTFGLLSPLGAEDEALETASSLAGTSIGFYMDMRMGTHSTIVSHESYSTYLCGLLRSTLLYALSLPRLRTEVAYCS